jgi:arylsulfatase A-like enzyme
MSDEQPGRDKIRFPWKALVLVWAALAVIAPQASSSATQVQTPAKAQIPARPNIVFILSDDQAHNTLSIAGHSHLKTPNLDRMAREGAWLRQAFAATPLCAPSRAAFLTGLSGQASGFRTNNGPWPEQFPPSFLKVARDAGYRTAFIGKKHIYNTDEPLPGVDRWVSFVNQGLFVNPDVNIDGERRKLEGANGDLLTDFAVEFIRRNRELSFAMVVAYKEAHSQQTAPPRYDSLFEDTAITLPGTFDEDKSTKPGFFIASRNIPDSGFDEPNRGNAALEGMSREQRAIKKIKNYYRCITALDDYVGRIRNVLEETGQLDRTILVFAGDNGYFLGDHGRFEKMTPHEESVRIPFLIRYPAAIRAGTVSDELVMNIDLAPTLYDLAGLKGPDRLDGRSLRPLLVGRRPAAGASGRWRQEVYLAWQGAQGAVPRDTPGYRPAPPAAPTAAGANQPQPPPLIAAIPTWRALRTRTHKYAVYLNGDLSELYDLAADPKETRNLIADPAQKQRIEQLHRLLLESAEKTGDPLRSMLPAAPSLKRVELTDTAAR